MSQESKVRLGGVEAVCDAGKRDDLVSEDLKGKDCDIEQTDNN